MIVVYDKNGRITRRIRNDTDTERHVFPDEGGFIEVSDDTDIRGKVVDVETGELVDDSDYEPPKTMDERVEERVDERLRELGVVE